MSERTAWKICSENRPWSAFGKKRARSNKKTGPEAMAEYRPFAPFRALRRTRNNFEYPDIDTPDDRVEPR